MLRLTASQGSFPENSFFAEETNVRLSRGLYSEGGILRKWASWGSKAQIASLKMKSLGVSGGLETSDGGYSPPPPPSPGPFGSVFILVTLAFVYLFTLQIIGLYLWEILPCFGFAVVQFRVICYKMVGYLSLSRTKPARTKPQVWVQTRRDGRPGMTESIYTG